MKNVKKRNWAFVLYPESAPENWRQFLQDTGLQCCISPLHDKDINPNGEVKKPHYHIIIVYSGPTSYNVVNSLCESLNQPIPQPLEQIKGYYRYLTHKDNPEKFQYLESDISTINGFNIRDFVEFSSSELLKLKLELQQFVRDYDILEYSDLCNILQDNDLLDLYEVAVNNTYYIEKYITSRRHKFDSNSSLATLKVNSDKS